MQIPNQTVSVFSAVFPTLGKDLDTTPAFADINVDLAVFSIHFGFNAHQARAHVNAVIYAASFKPLLPPHFGR
jgi:hypothetical protein